MTTCSRCEPRNVSSCGSWQDRGGRSSGKGKVVKLKEKDVA